VACACCVGFFHCSLLWHPIRLRPAGRRETRRPTAGKEVCPEIAKTGLIGDHLCV
jgi:hypothetical protein